MYCALVHLTAISQIKNKNQEVNSYIFTTESFFAVAGSNIPGLTTEPRNGKTQLPTSVTKLEW